MGAEGEHVAKLLPLFEKIHPEIAIKIQKIPWSSAHEKLLTAYAGQSTPDICQLGNTWISEFHAIGALLQLDSLINHSQVIQDSNYFAGIWDTNVLADHVYGIPWYVDTRLLYYRTDILKEVGYDHPPQNWREWWQISKAIKDKNSNSSNYSVFFSLIYNDWFVPVVLIMENNGKLLQQNNSYGAFDDPNTIAALQFYLGFFKAGLSPDNMTEVTNIYQGFKTGFFSMFISGPWNVNEVRRRCPEIQGQWDTAMMPKKQNQNSTAGGSSLVIFKNSKNKAAAWKWIEFLSAADIQSDFFRLTKDLPAHRASWKDSLLQNDRQILAFYDQLQHVQPTPKIAEWEQIAVKIQEHCETVIYGRKTLSEAISQLNRDVDQILEKRRWLLEKNLIQ